MDFVRIENPVECDDTNNCTIIALHMAAAIPYKKANKIGLLAGRKPKQGCYLVDLFKAARKEGIRFRKRKVERMTLRKFLTKYPKGRFVVEKRGHAFAVIDGKYYDTVDHGIGSIIIGCYKVESHRIETIKKILKKDWD